MRCRVGGTAVAGAPRAEPVHCAVTCCSRSPCRRRLEGEKGHPVRVGASTSSLAYDVARALSTNFAPEHARAHICARGRPRPPRQHLRRRAARALRPCARARASHVAVSKTPRRRLPARRAAPSCPERSRQRVAHVYAAGAPVSSPRRPRCEERRVFLPCSIFASHQVKHTALHALVF